MTTPLINARLTVFPIGAFLLLCLATTSLRAQTADDWAAREAQAIARAKAEKKHVLLDLAADKWCAWSKFLEKEVFNSPEFLAYTADRYVVVKMECNSSEQLQICQARYHVDEFPTVIVLDGDGKTLGTIQGYQRDGPAAFIEKLRKL